ncbi:MAG: hypothetical protein GX605_02975 [Chloroflexi bacterium]|nr:hypothetical protein [Chloroflexota bacterium]
MDALLWVMQAVLAAKFLVVVYTHGLRPGAAAVERGRQQLGAAARPLLALAALASALGALGLVGPAAVGALAAWVPWAAALLAGISLGSAGLHLKCQERPNSWVGLALGALAAFVAYGRWALAPL